MAIKKITRRWLINSFSVILLILVVIIVAVSYSIQQYYYNTVHQFIESRAQAIQSQLVRYSTDSSLDYDSGVRNLIQEFADKNKMELMALDINGNVVITSSGFAVQNSLEMPDFNLAKTSGEGVGEFRGTIEGENIMAVTFVTPEQDVDFYAFRYIVSLNRIDAQITTLIILIALLGISIILFVIWSSSYFINSIVSPVGEIGKTAKRIAEGDFESRLKKKTDDEIGELCDAINYMAGELSATEKMKNDFISSVSHELRTPLTAIRGWSETMMSSPGDPDITEKGMRVITSETERLSQMVEELLDFSRMQSGRLTVAMDRMDLLAELEEAVLMYTQKARRENISLEYNGPEMLPVIVGDRNRLKQVFVNVIDNAIKYSNAGDKVVVDAYQDSDYICVEISDTGCGIRARDLPKIKTKFYKANLTRRGSGIGLALADEIVKMHKGTLEIDSEENVGTTVLIRLPIHLKSE